MNPIDLLTTVNEFYDQAFNRLLIITFGLMAFMGVAVPIAVGWLQLRTLRAEKASLVNELRAEISTEREAIEQNIKDQVEEQIKAIKSDYDSRFKSTAASIKKSSASAQARAHHLQGNALLNNKQIDQAIIDFCFSTSLYFTAGEEDNARRCIEAINLQCLPQIDSDQYKQPKLTNACEGLISTLKKHNENSRYKDDIDMIELEMKKASNRKTASPADYA